MEMEALDPVVEGFKIYLALLQLHKISSPIPIRIRNWAEVTPYALAVKDKNTALSYKDVEDRSNIIANHLLSLNTCREQCIGVHLRESALIPVVVLGIMKAGCTYVPLSVDLPANRINYIVQDAAISIIITDAANDQLSSNNAEVVELDIDLHQIHEHNNAAPGITLNYNDAAYIIYTSGSTGDPKGVVVSHGSMTNYLDWYLEDLQQQSGACLPLTSSISFAAGVTQLFSALLQGEPLHIIERSIVRQPALLLEWYAQNPGHAFYCVPTLWEEVMNYVESATDTNITPPSCLFLSGEALSKSLADRTFRRWPLMQIWNLYGPTEATANVSYYKVEKGKDIYLGKPIRGARLFLLNEELKPVREGEEGFIYVICQTLAREYRNKPRLSEQSFLKHHNLEGFQDHTLYNTGDIGKFTSDNELMFLGRKDQQVKVRGHRIELSEVEKHLQAVKGIRQAACKVATNANGQSQLHAFVVCHTNVQLTVNDIRSSMMEHVAAGMIPDIFHFLDAMPKLPNGKINRHLLLPEINYAGRAAHLGAYVAPQTGEEKMMLGIWEEVLQIQSAGMHDDFFELGGNSLKMMRLINLIKSRMSKDVSLQTLWKYTTPHLLLQQMNGDNNTPGTAKLVRQYGGKKVVSLSLNQMGQWFTLQSRAGLTAYNMLFTLQLPHSISSKTVQEVLNAMLLKHDVLRSNFRIENNLPMRVISDNTAANFEVHNLSGADADFEKALTDRLFHIQYDLEKDALARFHLLQYADGSCKLFAGVHHLIFDSFSINVFARDFCNLLKGDASITPEYAYDDYVQWEKKNYYDENMSGSFMFWKQKLAGSNHFLDFPTDNARPKIQSVQGKNKTLVVDAALITAIEAYNRNEKITPFILLLSVFNVMLHKYTGETDILTGVPFANRLSVETASIMGLFANTVVYRTNVLPQQSFRELVHAVRNYTGEVMQHQSYPLPKLLEQLNPERSVSYHPLFQVMFAYNDKLQMQSANDAPVHVEELQNPGCKFDLELEVQENSNDITLNFRYNAALFHDATIDAFMLQYKNILLQVLQRPHDVIASYTLESENILQQKLDKWNNTARDTESCCLQERFHSQVQKTPDAIAVHCGNDNITYSALDKKANAIAHALLQEQVRPDTLVGIMANRSIEMMAGILGILKAGAAYIPFDTQWPAERLQYIISSSGLNIVLVQDKYKTCFESFVTVINLEEESLYHDHSSETPSVLTDPSNLAYVIFTSGSTGMPKGVMIEHRSVINRIAWMQRTYLLNDKDVILQKTPITFDVSVWELFWWFFDGGSVHMLEPGGEKNPETIIEAIRLHNVSTLHFVPSMFNTFLEYLKENPQPATTFNAVRRIFTSGEALEKHHVEKFNRYINAAGAIQLINLYGPTEATVDVSYFDCTHAGQYARIPIGKPIDNIQLYVLDEQNRPVPEKIRGELCIGGIGLARGYINNEALTDEKFFQNRFTNSRLYRTGDQARWLPDGNIEYLGRTDHQVKIRGQRIELGEIETAINKHTEIEASAAVVKKLAHDDVRLVAYYVPRNSGALIDLKSHLRRSLPDNLIPSAFVPLDALPLLSSGKLDTKSLPHPFERRQKAIGAQEFSNQTEKQIAAIWMQALKHNDFDAEDNFYDVGGHSLLLIKIKIAMDAEFDVKIPLVELFQYPTIRSVAEMIASKATLHHKTAIGERARLQKKAIQRLKRN
jgi:amino acid adenylation domain-containing protein